MKIKREAKIGFFALLMLAALYWGVNYLRGQDIFNRSDTYYATYDQVNGLQQSAAIVIKGFKVGVISDIVYDPVRSDKIVLELSIRSKYRIPANSQARIYSDGLLGGKAIEIVPGNAERYLVSGDTLHSAMDKDFLEVAGSELEFLKQKATVLVDDISKTLNTVNSIMAENAANINAAMGHLAGMTASLDDVMSSRREQMREIVDNINTLTLTLRNNSGRIDSIVANVETLTGSLAHADIASVVADLSESVAHLNSTLAKVDAGSGSLGLLVNDDEFYRSLTEASNNLSVLLEDMRRHPERYVSISVFGGRGR